MSFIKVLEVASVREEYRVVTCCAMNFSNSVLGTTWYFLMQMVQYGDEVLGPLQGRVSCSHRSLKRKTNYQFISHAVIMKFNGIWYGVTKPYQVCELLSIQYLSAVPKTLLGDICLFFLFVNMSRITTGR
jgi:hypothetical protein